MVETALCSMCDHVLAPVATLARPELATRMLVHKDRIGLAQVQVDRITLVVRSWRERYHQVAGQLLRLEHAVDSELAHLDADVARTSAAIDERAELFRQMESEFVQTWLQLWEIIDHGQYERLLAIYAAELDLLPPAIKASRVAVRETV